MSKPVKPLSEKSRPLSFDDFKGQKHLTAASAPFRKLVEKDLFSSIILWGPPGTGKTSLAHIVSQITQAEFVFSFSRNHRGKRAQRDH